MMNMMLRESSKIFRQFNFLDSTSLISLACQIQLRHHMGSYEEKKFIRIILHGLKVWCMFSCSTPMSQSECRKLGSTSTKGNNVQCGLMPINTDQNVLLIPMLMLICIYRHWTMIEGVLLIPSTNEQRRGMARK